MSGSTRLCLPGAATDAGIDPAPLEQWVTYQRANGLKERTITERVGFIVRMARELGGKDPATWTFEDILAWFAQYCPQSAWTRWTYRGHCKAWFTYCQLAGIREDDPMLGVTSIKAPRSKPRPLTTAQVERLLAVTNRRRSRMYVLLAAYLGLRVHEIAKIRGEDVDRTNNTVRVIGKGGTDEVLPLHPRIVAELDEWPESGYWFTSYAKLGRSASVPVQPDAVSQAIKDALTRAGIPGCTAHQLRHWYGTMLVKSGADLRTTQTLMRHASLATTAIYVATDSERQAEAISRLPLVG